jgi:protein TonB
MLIKKGGYMIKTFLLCVMLSFATSNESVQYESASFNGGNPNTFVEWVNARLVYPESAIDNNIEGCVVVSFKVLPNGYITNVKVVKGIDTELDREAIRVVSSSPKWKPSRVNGVATETSYTIPINFKLT